MTNNEYVDSIIQAASITTVTLVRFFKTDYPRKHGNCFSVKNENSQEYHIVNFNHENLKHLIEEKVIEFPIDILPIGDNTAILCDSRIPNEYYSDHFCENSCPRDLLPMPQRLKQILDIKSGKREEFTHIDENGNSHNGVKINHGDLPVYVYLPYTLQETVTVITGSEPKIINSRYKNVISGNMYETFNIKANNTQTED